MVLVEITIRNRRFLRKYTPVCKPDRRKSILDDLKYLPTSPPVDQPSPTPTTPTESEPTPIIEAPNHPDDLPTPGVLTPSSLVGEHQPIAPTTLPGSSKPSPQLPVVTSDVSLSPMSSQQPPCPETLKQPPAKPDASLVKLRHSTQIRKPPKWQTSDDFILY